jgi:hypothetical protein
VVTFLLLLVREKTLLEARPSALVWVRRVSLAAWGAVLKPPGAPLSMSLVMMTRRSRVMVSRDDSVQM